MQLVIQNLNKTYANGVHALQDVSLNIPTGMFGLLGPNGAGKSTLMRTIATLQDADSGSIHLGELDVLKQPDEVRKVLGYLPQEFGLYPNISAEVTLDHFATLKGINSSTQRRDVVHALLKQTNLYDQRSKNVGGFSGGMKQRLGIAIALLGQPKLVIVDEPTAGLDPTERRRFLNLLAEISENVIVILSTHIVEDVTELCSNMAMIAKGQVVAAGAPQSFINELQGNIWQCTVARTELAALADLYHVISSRLVGGRPVVHVYAEQCPDDAFSPVDASLEDVYFYRLGTGLLVEGKERS